MTAACARAVIACRSAAIRVSREPSRCPVRTGHGRCGRSPAAGRPHRAVPTHPGGRPRLRSWPPSPVSGRAVPPPAAEVRAPACPWSWRVRQSCFPLISRPLTSVGGRFPLIGDPVPLVGHPVPPVSRPVPQIGLTGLHRGYGLVAIGDPVPLVGHPVPQIGLTGLRRGHGLVAIGDLVPLVPVTTGAWRNAFTGLHTSRMPHLLRDRPGNRPGVVPAARGGGSGQRRWTARPARSRGTGRTTESTLAAESTEATEKMDPDRGVASPADPIDRMEPLEPMDRIDPVEPMLRIDPDEPMLRIEPDERREPSVACMGSIVTGRPRPAARSGRTARSGRLASLPRGHPHDQAGERRPARVAEANRYDNRRGISGKPGRRKCPARARAHGGRGRRQRARAADAQPGRVLRPAGAGRRRPRRVRGSTGS